MITAARNSAVVLLAALLLAGCTSNSRRSGWNHEHALGGGGFWGGLEGSLQRYYPSEHPSSSPMPHTTYSHVRR
jgi:hypothetical protein